MPKLGVEDGEHSPLEFFAPRHCEGDCRRRVMAHRSHDVEQMLRVITRACPARQREIVARTLALRAKLFCGRPHKRVEPVDRACETSKRMSDEIVAANMRELMQQHCKPAIRSPV